MKIKLSALIDDFDIQNDETTVYLDKETGKLLLVTSEDRSAHEDESDDDNMPEWLKKQREAARPILEEEEKDGPPVRYLILPDKFDFHEYRVMESFICGLSPGGQQDDLFNAISGRGAFRRFKDTIRRQGREPQWYAHKDRALRNFIIEWCKEQNISFIDDAKETGSARQ